MTSHARTFWQTQRLPQLDELEAAHRAVGGVGRGRRTATQQINHAYAVLLCSHFQGFCRDLHSEAVDYIASAILPESVRQMLRDQMTDGRKLDRGNANAGNIGHDFGRLGMELWPAARALDGRTRDRQCKLDEAALWRNAIAHQDFSTTTGSLQIRRVRGWRSALTALAFTWDGVVADHLRLPLGHRPW